MSSQLEFLRERHGLDLSFIGVDGEEARGSLLAELGLPEAMSVRVVSWGRIANIASARRIWKQCVASSASVNTSPSRTKSLLHARVMDPVRHAQC